MPGDFVLPDLFGNVESEDCELIMAGDILVVGKDPMYIHGSGFHPYVV